MMMMMMMTKMMMIYKGFRLHEELVENMMMMMMMMMMIIYKGFRLHKELVENGTWSSYTSSVSGQLQVLAKSHWTNEKKRWHQRLLWQYNDDTSTGVEPLQEAGGVG